MASVEDFMKIDYASFMEKDIEDGLEKIVDDLLQGGVSIDKIKVGSIPDISFGWTEEDLEEELVGGTLWVETDDEELMNEIKLNYEPDEFSIYKGKYRLWWD